MLANTAWRLFISSCAVAIYPAAIADNSTISHQLQREGHAWQSPLHTVNSLTPFLLTVRRQTHAESWKQNQRWRRRERGKKSWLEFTRVSRFFTEITRANLFWFHIQFISFDKGIHLAWNQTFEKKCTCYLLSSTEIHFFVFWWNIKPKFENRTVVH